jgi:type III secretion protein V
MAGVPRYLLRELPALSPALMLALMLACVLLPLPQLLVDLLLSASLAFAVLLLVAAVRVEVPARFSTFPRLLLLVTSLRLVLNLATTRLILGEADAGQVIDAFAGFVTRGDLVVGAVMFGIVTAIQFFVIARGTERVAEVAARFALDGMPGRQAAIAADLASGIISAGEAARRRKGLDVRSDFYGAMDGAVKFVKGDAIVGLAIVAVNLVGGLAIGVGRLGYSVGESLQIYGRLTIGDGLLTQIPAVLVSLAAGVLVSRIESLPGEEEGSWFQPAMLLVPAALLLGVALVPGMPALAFALVGALLLAGAWVAMARGPRGQAETNTRLTLHLPAQFGLSPERIASTLPSLRTQCEAATGLALPGLEVHLGGERGRVELFSTKGRLASTPLLAGADAEVAWLNAAYRVLVEGAPRHLSLSSLELQLEGIEASDPAALREMRRRLELPELLALQRGFLRSGVPIPPLGVVVAALAELPVFADRQEQGRWPQRLREAAASSWLPVVLEAHAAAGSGPRFVGCEPDLVLAIESATRLQQGRWVCSLDAGTSERTRRALIGEKGAGVVVVARASERARLAAYFASVHPPVPVLAWSEFDAASMSRPSLRWLDERAYEEAMVPPSELVSELPAGA